MAWSTADPNRTRHTCGGPHFGRLAPEGKCPRCDELRAGAKPRHFRSRYAETAQQRIAAIRAHDCKKSNCGPVCTAFDW